MQLLRTRLPIPHCVILPSTLVARMPAISDSGDQVRSETCGVMVGRRHGDALVISGLPALPNAAAAPASSFRIEPLEVLRARRRTPPDQVVGFWHTHPSGALVPSPQDRSLHERFLSVVPGRVRPERAMGLVRAGDPFGCAVFWYTSPGWVRVPVDVRAS